LCVNGRRRVRCWNPEARRVTGWECWRCSGCILCDHLSNGSLDLVDFSLARKIGLQALDDLLQNVLARVVDFVSDVDVVSVGTPGTETVFTFVDGSLLQQRAEVLELTRLEFKVFLQVLDHSSSGLRDLLGLDEGQSSEAHIGEAQDEPSQVWR
jgi:hypothetical protein